MTTLKKLVSIQSKLKAPKNKNAYGKYNFRSCEDILEAVKPLANELEACVMLRDAIVMIGDRFYVESTATLVDEEGEISTKAYARESTSKNGMDSSQITGSSSSYARKYALNGLFAIDDNKDADTEEYNDKVKAATEAEAKAQEVEKKKLDALINKLLVTANKKGFDAKRVETVAKSKLKHGMKDLTIKECNQLITGFETLPDKMPEKVETSK